MDWPDQLRLLRWRALEEGDPAGEVLSLARRAEADQMTKTELERIAWLEIHGRVDDEQLPRVAAWHLPACLGWALAFGCGYALTYPGHDRLINLLSLPLLSLLVWNAVIVCLSLLKEFKAKRTEAPLPDWLLWPRRSVSVATAVQTRFRALARPWINARRRWRLVAWFHVAAAVLALGTITGMYAKGWSREYQAIWESTLLNETSAQRFLAALYRPASITLGLPLPVDQLPTMRLRPNAPATPSEALPWIHLYAGTLLLLVLLPRLALAALMRWRGVRAERSVWARLNAGYAKPQGANHAAGIGVYVQVLCHGWRAGDEPRARWSPVLRSQFGGQCLIEYQDLPAGNEDDFLAQWQPKHAQVVLAFKAATTPENEVHAALARGLHTRLQQQNRRAKFIALLDTQTLKDRRTDEAVATRLQLWQTTLHGTVDSILQA